MFGNLGVVSLRRLRGEDNTPYLNIPLFFNYDKLQLTQLICSDKNIKCAIKGKIKYSFYPTPRLKIEDFVISDFGNEKQTLATFKEGIIKISINNLTNKNIDNFTKIQFKNAEVNFNVQKIKEYIKFVQKKINVDSINLEKGKITFVDGKKYIATINNINLKHRSLKKFNETVLKGEFGSEKIQLNLKSDNIDENASKTLIFKISDSQLYTKINITKSNLKNNTVNGDFLFKKNKNRLTGNFDFKDGELSINRGNIRNIFLDGEIKGIINFLPFFNFDVDIDLQGVNFKKFSNFLLLATNKNKKNDFYKINKKINGQINLTINKIYSKYGLAKSLESRIKFMNGDVFVQQLLLNLGKLGAADIVGKIENNKKFTNFKFEKNIFIDNQKYFFSKFGIFNKENIPSNLFISGSLDLKSLEMRFNEISNDTKFSEEDTAYIEKEFNNLLLEDGYTSFLNYLKLKEFIKLIFSEIN